MQNHEYRDELLIYGIKPTGKEFHVPEYIKYDKLFSPPECQSLIDTSNKLDEWSVATIGNAHANDQRVDKNYRQVQTCSLYPEGSEWFYHKLLRHIKWTNDQHFKFDIAGLNEFGQMLHYMCASEGNPPGHYDWHQDYGGGYASLRKLSIVVQLSDPVDYDGCRLTLKTHRDIEIPETKQGDVIIFPSYLPHRVSNITRGHRYAMALWVSGAPFR